MKDQTKEGLALRLALFFSIPGFITFEEYSPLYFKQLGFSSSDIGLTSLSAIIVPSIAVTSIGILADRLRARKTVLFLCITISIPVILAPLLPMVVIEKICKVTTIANASHKIATLTKERSGNNTNNWSILNGVLNSRDAIVNPQVLKLSAMTPIVKNRQSDISFGNSTVSSINTSKEIDSTNLFPFWFAFVILVRMVYDILKRTVDTMLKVSVASYVTRIGGNFGAYHCWIDIGAILSVFTAGMLASCTTYDICGKRDHGYFVLVPCPRNITLDDFRVSRLPRNQLARSERRRLRSPLHRHDGDGVFCRFLSCFPGRLGVLVHRPTFRWTSFNGRGRFHASPFCRPLLLCFGEIHREIWRTGNGGFVSVPLRARFSRVVVYSNSLACLGSRHLLRSGFCFFPLLSRGSLLEGCNEGLFGNNPR